MMPPRLEILVEDPSTAAFLDAWLPKIVPGNCKCSVRAFNGKRDLLGKVRERLLGYSKWIPNELRIIVLVDRDLDDRHDPKRRLEGAAPVTLATRSHAGVADWRIANRIAVEELEAWFFSIGKRFAQHFPACRRTCREKRFRLPDQICGGTWEALEHVLKRGGYYPGGLVKTEAARRIGEHFCAERCTSPSFQCFFQAVREAMLSGEGTLQ